MFRLSYALKILCRIFNYSKWTIIFCGWFSSKNWILCTNIIMELYKYEYTWKSCPTYIIFRCLDHFYSQTKISRFIWVKVTNLFVIFICRIVMIADKALIIQVKNCVNHAFTVKTIFRRKWVLQYVPFQNMLVGLLWFLSFMSILCLASHSVFLLYGRNGHL